MNDVSGNGHVSRTHETAPVTRSAPHHKSTHVDRRARLYRGSLFRHAAHATTHPGLGSVDHLLHLLGGHGGHGAAQHVPTRHDTHGNHPHSGHPTHPKDRQGSQQQKQSHSQHRSQQNPQQQKQHQQSPRHRPNPAQTRHDAARPAHHPGHGSWQSRRDGYGSHHAAPGSNARAAAPFVIAGGGQQQGGGQHPGARADARTKVRAINRIAAIARTELQALAARTLDQPLIYPSAMREAILRQRCTGLDPFAVTDDVLKARELARDYTDAVYDDLHSFLLDFLRVVEGTGARGALRPLLAFHDLRRSSPGLRRRAIAQFDALMRMRMLRAYA